MDGLWVEKIQPKRISEFTEITQNNIEKEIKIILKESKRHRRQTQKVNIIYKINQYSRRGEENGA